MRCDSDPTRSNSQCITTSDRRPVEDCGPLPRPPSGEERSDLRSPPDPCGLEIAPASCGRRSRSSVTVAGHGRRSRSTVAPAGHRARIPNGGRAIVSPSWNRGLVLAADRSARPPRVATSGAGPVGRQTGASRPVGTRFRGGWVPHRGPRDLPGAWAGSGVASVLCPPHSGSECRGAVVSGVFAPSCAEGPRASPPGGTGSGSVATRVRPSPAN